MKQWCSLLLGLFFSSAISPIAVGIALPVKAQITVDGTSNTTLTPTDNGIRIDEGNRAGENLFHSFEQFSVLNGSEAFFNNTNNIVNIFSRVTGGNISNIDGLIRANGDANLFLINPAGIIFGENASLDIGGSFVGSTADSIVFSDNVEFSATDGDNPPLLTINMPIGLNFGNNTGEIALNGSNLQVNSGETFALLGGNVTITGGQIIAPGANIELGGLTEAGQVSFEGLGDEISFSSISFPEGVPRGDITLTNGAEVNVQAAGGGSIGINARNLELSGGELGASNLFAGIAPESFSPEAVAGNITINATDNITISQGSRIGNRVEESGVGNAGEIEINTANLFLTQGGRVSADTLGEGNAGVISINASETISADGEDRDGSSSGISSLVLSGAIGDSGRIDLTTANLTLKGGASINASTAGQGNAGAIIIEVSQTISADGEDRDGSRSGIGSIVASTGVGNSGRIDITTAKLSLRRGGVVVSSTLGQGNAGAITIKASDTISIDGEGQDGSNSGIGSQIFSGARGNSDGINITTNNLSLREGGTISASTAGEGNAGAITIEASGSISIDGEGQDGFNSGIGSQIFPGARGNSDGINITTNNLSLTQGSQITSATVGQGDAGAITIEASDTISVDGEGQDGSRSEIGSQIFPGARGNSGGISITTNNLYLREGGLVDASTFGQGNAGAITIEASGSISVDGTGQDGFSSGILSIVRDIGQGNAGGIDINANNLSVTNEAEISVESAGQGIANNLFIQANSLDLENGASLSASTPVRTGGNIILQIADNLILRDNSTISAQALENANGGNIDLDANFVIAVPNQNNDIIANAAQGTGGNIDITTNSIFGLEARNSTPPNNTNDIDASSELGLDGTIEINELEVNPAEGLEELPVEIIDVTRLVEQNLCQQAKDSEFIVTGKGGIAPSPTQARDGEISAVNLVEPATFEEDGEVVGAQGLRPAKEEIVEAEGWIINDRGILELVAYSTDVHSSPAQPKDAKICHQ